jgi:hypothetical protein
VRIEFNPEATRLTLFREPADYRPRRSVWNPDPLSTLLHWVKNALNARGFDLVKRRMWRDGHMYGDETLSYLRTRKPTSPGPHVYVYDGDYAIRDAVRDWWVEGEIELLVEHDVYHRQPDCAVQVRRLVTTAVARGTRQPATGLRR